jgi:hypothetical protein
MSQLLEVAQLAQSYQQAYQSGQLSPSDYKQLIEDLNIAGHIEANADVLDQNQEAYQVLMGAIQIASMIQ